MLSSRRPFSVPGLIVDLRSGGCDQCFASRAKHFDAGAQSPSPRWQIFGSSGPWVALLHLRPGSAWLISWVFLGREVKVYVFVSGSLSVLSATVLEYFSVTM